MKRPSRAVNSVLAVVLVGASVVAYRSVGADDSTTVSTSSTSTVARGTVLSTVTASGNVNAAEDLALSFQQSGTISEILVAVGDRVTAGQVLARVDNATQTLSLESAQAQLAAALAKAAKTQSGLTDAELAQNRASERQSAASVASSKQSLLNAQQTALTSPAGYQNAVDQAQTSVDVAAAQLATDETELQSRRSELASAQSGSDPSASSGETSSALVRRYQRDQSECSSSTGGSTTTTAASTSVASDGVVCNQVARLLQVAQNVQAQEKTVSQDATAVTSAENQLTNARTNQTSGLLKDQQQIATSQRQLESAQAAYEATLAGNAAKEKPPTEDQTASDQQSVTAAEVQVATAQRNLDQTTLVAPHDGTVSALNGTVGGSSSGSSASSSSSSATGSAGSTGASSSTTSGFLTLSDLDGLEVTASFSESDVAKVEVGQEATVTLDALSGTTVHGRVVAIALSSTTSNNVVSYKVRVALDSPPSTVKPGMTASVAVTVDHADDVLTLPTSAVSGNGTTTTLTVKADGKEATRTVVIGLRGDQSVEIVSGLVEGDDVVVKASTAGGAAAGGPPAGFGGGGGGLGGPGGGLGG